MRRDVMLCYPFEMKRLARWNTDILLQPKYDGERCRALIYNDNVTLLSSEGNTIISVPHINEALLKIGWSEIELDGELYTHGLPFEEIYSRVSRRVSMHSAYQEIQYHIFDIVSTDKQLDRLKKLESIPTNDIIKIVPTYNVRCAQDIIPLYDKFLSMGFEGFIVRHPLAPYKRGRSTMIMKYKPSKLDSYTILDFEEERDIYNTPKDCLGALICDSGNGSIFKVGTGFTDDQRQVYWRSRDSLIGKSVVVKYQQLTTNRSVPRFPVFVEITTD